MSKAQFTGSKNVIRFAAIAALALGASASQPTFAGSIDTTPLWDGSSQISCWGLGYYCTSSYGQIFSTTQPGALQDFTFYIKPNDSNSTNYVAYLYQWDILSNAPTGSELWNSGPNVFQGTAGSFSEVTHSTGGIGLSPGTSYIAFLSTVGQPSSDGYNNWGSFQDLLPGLSWTWSNDGSSFLTTWDGPFFPGNFAFKATITSTPAPLPLFGGAAAFGLSRRLRKRVHAARHPESH
jgi:hypothetical protein